MRTDEGPDNKRIEDRKWRGKGSEEQKEERGEKREKEKSEERREEKEKRGKGIQLRESKGGRE